MEDIVIFSWALMGVVLIYIFIKKHNEGKKQR
jgi:hypothetical protein